MEYVRGERGQSKRPARLPCKAPWSRAGLAVQRRLAPMRVRPTDPRRAPCRPYGLGRQPTVAQAEACPSGTSESFDLQAGVGTGVTGEETERNLREALELPVAGMREDGLEAPDPSSVVDYLEIAGGIL
jgi:hypothetical protein